MKVVILGCGNVGSVLVRLLARERSVESIVCGDIRKRAGLADRKVCFRKIDASDKGQILKLLRNERPDLVINVSLPSFNVKILECCLREKVNYMDLDSYWNFDQNPKAKSPYEIEQLKYGARFKQNNLVGLINAGVSPGLSNLLARECADHLDTVDYIKIRLIEDTKSEELFFAWSKECFLDEVNWKPLVYRDGKFKILENFSEEEEYDFPSPFGKRKVCLISQEEVGTIPLFIKVRNLDIKSYDNQIDVAKSLVRMGLVSTEKKRVGEAKISPAEFLSKVLPSKPNLHKNKKLGDAVFGLVVEAGGKRGNRKRVVRCSAIFPRQREINKLKLDANFISYPTALMAKLFAMSIPKIRDGGVFPPECLERRIRKSVLKQLPVSVKFK